MTIREHVFPPPPRASSSRRSTSTLPSGKMHGTNGDFHGSERCIQSSPSVPETLVGDGHTGLGDEVGGIEVEDDDMDLEEEEVPIVHVEVKLRPYSNYPTSVLRNLIVSWMKEMEGTVPGSVLEGWDEIAPLKNNVEGIYVDDPDMTGVVQVGNVDYRVHLYKSSESEGLEEFCADEDEEDGEKVSSASIRNLPSPDIDGLWKNLVYEGDLKSRLLQYISTAMQFSEANVDFNIVTWNRMVLLYGPPGTGKTSLCRALAQKLAIRMSDRYPTGKLVEINSHSLFSKWFSESGKLVQRLFSMVHDLVNDEQNFVVVMIDEVESLTRARSAAANGNEPSDAIRVVNALLTQLDKLKEKSNVLVMTTSNLSETIDPAFVDRADIKEYVGNPPPQAVYWILSGCIEELGRRQLAGKVQLLEWSEIERRREASKRDEDEGKKVKSRNEVVSVGLADLARRCCAHELSGRLLRRIPMLAHARYMAKTEGRPKRVEVWVEAMSRVVDDEVQSKVDMARKGGD